jgi:2-dehydro-3-deoxyphosphogluconate aldolase/(4S)-4-hydroxy-2-oxoglutarate aldolase
VQIVDELKRHRLLAIVRGTDHDAALRTVIALAECGVALIEVSLTTPNALGVIRRARAERDSLAIGAGTVLTADDVDRAVEAGARYLVTPALAPSLARARELGVPTLAGALTPSEVVQAMREGAAAVKLFPASLGGVGYFKALREPFPDVPIVPVGGVDADAARQYLAAGAIAVGVGSPLVGDAAKGGDLGGLRSRVALFRSEIAEAV